MTVAPCIDCGKIREVQLRHGIPTRLRCRHCANILNGKKSTGKFPIGEKHPHWKNGETIHNGYVAVRLDKSDPYYPMIDNSGYVKRSRLIMAQYLGRCLTSNEHVHHINKDITDDRIENLRIMSCKEHMSFHNPPKNYNHCPQVHPYNDINTYIDSQGTKRCRICMKEINKRAKERQKQRIKKSEEESI